MEEKSFLECNSDWWMSHCGEQKQNLHKDFAWDSTTDVNQYLVQRWPVSIDARQWRTVDAWHSTDTHRWRRTQLAGVTVERRLSAWRMSRHGEPRQATRRVTCNSQARSVTWHRQRIVHAEMTAARQLQLLNRPCSSSSSSNTGLSQHDFTQKWTTEAHRPQVATSQRFDWRTVHEMVRFYVLAHRGIASNSS